MVGTASAAVPARAQSTPLPGIDVSHWNAVTDWSAVKADGTRFVIAKATEGKDYVDPQYATYKAAAEAQGIVFGAYHFARPAKWAGNAVAQADWFVANAQLTDNNLVPVLDLEVAGGLGSKKLKRWVWDYVNEIEAQTGVKPMIYVSPSFWKTHMANATSFAKNGVRLWIAHWTTAAKPTVPASNWAGNGWTMWQYTSTGSVDGITGNVDQDRYNGTVLAPLKLKNNR